jgi:hypothetical protein
VGPAAPRRGVALGPHRERLNAWARVSDQAGRRFSVQVDASLEAGALEAGATQSEAAISREAATLLLGLPWELLHDGSSYLFQGAKPTPVRRRLPGTEGFGVAVVAPPIRILLITARPDDDACGYITSAATPRRWGLLPKRTNDSLIWTTPWPPKSFC